MSSKPRMVRTVKEVRLDELLEAATSRAMSIAAEAAFSVDGYDEKGPPTSLRLSKRTLTYFDVLAEELKISRNSAIEITLEQLVRSSRTEG